MKKYIFLAGALLLALPGLAQKNPVKWTFDALKKSETEYDLVFTALVDNGWYIYSQHLDEGGPIPTSFNFNKSDHYQLVGAVDEAGGNRKEGVDELFGINVIKFGNQVVFTQRIRVGDAGKPVRGNLQFMVCDDQRCLPPANVPFSFELDE